MPEPADPKWKQRQWQTYYESRADYIAELYETIRFAKHMMRFWESFGQSHRSFDSELIPLITFEREWLKIHQNELRRVIGR